MSKLPMDLSKFKKVSSDKHTSTFRHYEGHEIKVAHNKLSTKMRDSLSKIPLHKGKTQVQSFADGGTAQPSELEDMVNTLNPFHSDDSKLQADHDAAMASLPKEPAGQVDALSSSQPAPIPVDQPQPGTSPEMQGGLNAQSAPAAPMPGANALSALQQQKTGIDQAAAAQGGLGKQQAQVERDYQIQTQAEMAKKEVSDQKIRANIEGIDHDIMNGHIDPDRYTKNMSTGSKISTAISLILGGMGAGLTRGPNLGAQMLQSHIDADINAQKADLGRKENLLAHNIQMLGSTRAGTELTLAQNYKIVQSKLAQAAANAATPMAQAAAMQAKGILDEKIMQHGQSAAALYSANQGIGDPAQLVTVLVPPAHQAKALGEVKAAEDTRRMAGAIMKAFEGAAKSNTVLRTGAGMLRTPAEVSALHQAMQPTFQDLEGTVRQAAMDNTFKNITPAPGDVESTVQTKREALNDYLKSKLSAPTARAWGVDLSKFHSTAPLEPADPREGKTGTLPNGQRVIMKNGKLVPHNG